jgi:hypothetical protein
LPSDGSDPFKIGVQRCPILLSYFQNGSNLELSQAYTKFRTLSKNQFNSPTINVTGNGNDTAGGTLDKSTHTNTTIYGSTDTLLVVPSSSPTVTSFAKPQSSTTLPSEYALQVLEPPILLKPMQEPIPKGTIVNGTPISKDMVRVNGIELTPGEEYKIDFVVNYKSKTPAKFYANILPDAEKPETHRKAHLDNISVVGRALQGDGAVRFSLRGKAPMEKGIYAREVTLGLMDHQNWMTQPPFVTYSYPFAISVN